jgi:hypothetical protein
MGFVHRRRLAAAASEILSDGVRAQVDQGVWMSHSGAGSANVSAMYCAVIEITFSKRGLQVRIVYGWERSEWRDCGTLRSPAVHSSEGIDIGDGERREEKTVKPSTSTC